MIAEAREMGFSDDDLADMPTAALYKTIQIAARQQRDHLREMAKAKTVMNAEVRNPEPKQEYDFGTNPETGQPITEAEIHPTLAMAIKQNTELRKALQAKDQQDKQRNFWDVAETIDDIFENMGSKYEKILGKGTGVELNQAKDPGLKRRLAVLAEAGINVEGVSAAQIRRMSGKIKAAADLLYGPALEAAPPPPADPNPYSQPAKKNGAPPPVSTDEWEEGAVAVPTSRPPVELPPGDERAVKNLEQKMNDLRAHGSRGRQSDAEIKRGLFPGGSVAG
jgi:hypothetical protein